MVGVFAAILPRLGFAANTPTCGFCRLCRLALLEYHLYEAVDCLYSLSSFAFLIAKSEDSEYDIVEQVGKSLPVRSIESELLVFGCVDNSHCIKDVRECNRCVEVIA